MKWKALGFAIIAIITVPFIAPLAFAGSEDYLVPVEIGKADRTAVKGYIVLHGEEILRLCGACSKRGEDPSQLLEFELIKFMEGGSEVFITYGNGRKPIVTENFFSRKGIQFTTKASNLDVLPQFLAPGKIHWIKRTGRPTRIQ